VALNWLFPYHIRPPQAKDGAGGDLTAAVLACPPPSCVSRGVGCAGHQVRICRDRFSPTGELGYELGYELKYRGAVGVGYRSTV
jgi:hypothetical protein